MIAPAVLLLASAGTLVPGTSALIPGSANTDRGINLAATEALGDHRRSLSDFEEEDYGTDEAAGPGPASADEYSYDYDTSYELNTSGGCTPPSTIGGVSTVIAACKTQAPTSETQVEELNGFCDEFFSAQDGYMRFMTTSERSELRCPENTDQQDGFIVSEATASFQGTLRLPNTNLGTGDQYTFMQLHGDDTSWIRMAHYGEQHDDDTNQDVFNNLFLFLKSGSSSSSTDLKVNMGPVPTGDFDAGIELPGDGTVTISCGSFSQTFDIDWSDILNYFKAGSYVQDGDASTFPVDYSSLTYSLDGGANML